jgi:HK97 family phage portal protein
MRPKSMSPDELSRLITSTYGGGATGSGVSVTTRSAMRAMAVHSCVTIKANAIAQLPCHLMQRDGRNKKQATDFYLYSLLHDQPNEWMTAPEFWGMVSACLDLQGNFFALKTGLPGRPIREIVPCAIGSVEEVIQTPNYGLWYKVRRPTSDSTNDGTMKNSSTIVDTIPGNRIMHLRGLVLNGFMGLNPIAYARESIGLALSTEKHAAKLFSHGTLLGGLLKWDKHFKSDDDAKRLIASFNEVYSSVENAHKTALLEDGVTWEKMQMTSEDSQFMEARNFQKKEIVDLFFGMPLSMLQSGDKVATYASAEQFALQFVTYTLMPRLVNIERGVSRDCLTSEEKKIYYPKFSAEGLLRGDSAARATWYREMINAEVICPNEAREKEDYNPYDGGDEFRTRTSSVKQPESAPPPKEGAPK